MSLIAIGNYLRTMREFHSLSRIDVAKKIRTSEQQVLRIEAGEIDTRASLLLEFVNAVQGNAEDLRWLVERKMSTAEEGRKLAHAWRGELHADTIELYIRQSDGSYELAPFYATDYFDTLPNDALLEIVQHVSTMLRERLNRAPKTWSGRRGLWRRRRRGFQLPSPEPLEQIEGIPSRRDAPSGDDGSRETVEVERRKQ